MATFRRFEDIEAWQRARDLTSAVYEAAEQARFARDLRFAGQITSAAVSVMSNIAEGFERDNRKDFLQFLYIAKGSAGEVRSQLYVALDRKYITQAQFESLYGAVLLTSRLVAALIAYLQHTRITGGRHKVQLET